MTEGNITSWKVKEGDSFSAGDVLLEIETDKAQMDVEAQDDGVVAKITQGNGSKSVKVGSRIGVLAEPGDDLSSLSLPAEDSKSVPSPQEDTASGIDTSESSESAAEAPPTSKPSAEGPVEPGAGAGAGAGASKSSKPSNSSSRPTKQTYPLYPSVQHLLHERGLSTSEADKIPASGPNGRLLKGDVLSYLGRIASSYSSDESTRISKLGHLDLSNIKVAKQTPKVDTPPTKAAPPSVAPEPELDMEVAVSISLHSVTQVQKRVQETLGIFLPLSTFIARATDVANDDLPRSKTASPSADELFNQVLGLDKVHSTCRGSFTPQITALPAKPLLSTKPKSSSSADIIDILAGKTSSMTRGAKPVTGIMAGTSSATNVFSVSVPRGEEKRARVFLDRVKNVLETEPGRLVL
ncbi:MAG: hypothetical protein M1812_000144 [Candelaria pacifica]|nr:MAG: hypothetical protein M1812_000144 [Candelaria pacifica]